MKKLFPNLKVEFSEAELGEVNQHLQKFNIFFTKEEFALLQKYALKEIVGVLKQVSEVQFTKEGMISIDTIYQVGSLFGEKLRKMRIKNPFPLLAIFEKFIVVILFKLDETDELTTSEKSEVISSIFGSVDKTLFIENTSFATVFPKAAELRKTLAQKFKALDSAPPKKTRKPIPTKTVLLLQKEINSKCPFPDCENEDVDHFQTHHIDEDPSNNSVENLLRLCPNCHSKITKGDYTKEFVITVKKGLKRNDVEIYKIDVDANNCAWEPFPDVVNGFRLIYGSKLSPLPIFQFGIINHLKKTIVLKGIELKVQKLSDGISGPRGDTPVPAPVTKLSVKQIFIDYVKPSHFVKDFEDIEIPQGRSLYYQLEVIRLENNILKTLESRMLLSFIFSFSNNMTINVPNLLINTKNELQGMEIRVLS